MMDFGDNITTIGYNVAKGLVSELTPPRVESVWESRGEREATEFIIYCNYLKKKKKKKGYNVLRNSHRCYVNIKLITFFFLAKCIKLIKLPNK